MRAQIGDVVPLELQLSDGSAAMFPRALIYNAAGTLLATKDLAHVANGRYTNDTFTMPADASSAGAYVQVTYIVYSDAGHTTVAGYGYTSELWQRDHVYLATVSSGATTSIIPCSLAGPPPNFTDALVRYVSGSLKGEVKKIGSYTAGQIQLASGLTFSGAGSVGDIIEIVTR